LVWFNLTSIIMVFSKLPKCETLAYPELARLESDDVHYTSDAYETEIKGVAVTVAFGKVKREFEAPPYEVVYYPIYLIHKYSHDVIRKIGVVEYFKTDESRLDENLELDVASAPFRPLIFAYITVDLLKLANLKSAEISKRAQEEKRKKREKRVQESQASEKQEKRVFETPKKITMLAANTDAVTSVSALRPVVRVDSVEDPGADSDVEVEAEEGVALEAETVRDVTLPTQTKALADKERAEYVSSGSSGGGGGGNKQQEWIQQFMKNRHFGIEDNEGGNDSLFACIRDGLLSQGNTTLTIEKMRVKLAEMATKELFQEYMKHYNKYVALYKQASEQLQEKNKQIVALKERIQGKHLSAKELLEVKSELERLAKAGEDKKSRVEFLKEIVTHHYGYMRHTEGKFENFKTILTTRAFVPDAWALRALERAYNISIVRMSESRFKDGDLDNVVVCGDRSDDAPGLGLGMVTTSSYKPAVFIVVSVNDDTSSTSSTSSTSYRLIRYRSKGSFSFAELPYDIRTQIVTKCIENPETEFAFLPQFKRVLEIYPTALTGQKRRGAVGGDAGSDYSDHSDHDDGMGGGGDGSKSRAKDVPVFQIYNRAGTDKPGRGAGEYMPSGMQHLFVPLATHAHWRRALTNMSESPFVLDGRTWFSVEHYYQGSKFKKHNHDFYLQFALDSKSEISKNPELAKAAGSERGMFRGKLYRPKAVTVDRDFVSSGRGAQALVNGMEAKFQQNPEMKNILLGTLNARIYHFQRGERPILFRPLLQIRAKLEARL
jgi:predicted NAD-dependent protein-ADP-ribosyltransferase YbiA (DUF1768 family)